MPDLDPKVVVDAVDELMDGVMLFDAADKLVFCNRRQKELYPQLADLLVTGTSFETLVRSNVGQGQVDTAIGREEEWIAARLLPTIP
ncbi:MAG: PAS-domain containing protein [Alphaproteobacteria bacterium]|jgi:hypothetical protein|nr:PAS-domain containing protein [Alphaproteobacteria bacterium]MDP6811777.1 PAS-domain containing protein [Alphaproteobacteria bacterium]|tara:strand:+ start:263 stop:523 length:261 start_codon:yes stop_codon:yes gene_type:complete